MTALDVIALWLAFQGAMLTLFLPISRQMWAILAEQPDRTHRRWGVGILGIALLLALLHVLR